MSWWEDMSLLNWNKLCIKWSTLAKEESAFESRRGHSKGREKAGETALESFKSARQGVAKQVAWQEDLQGEVRRDARKPFSCLLLVFSSCHSLLLENPSFSLLFLIVLILQNILQYEEYSLFTQGTQRQIKNNRSKLPFQFIFYGITVLHFF